MVLRPNDFETSHPFLRTYLNSAAELVPVVVELVLPAVVVEVEPDLLVRAPVLVVEVVRVHS